MMYGSLCGERNLIIVLSYVSWRTEVIREFKENGIIYLNKVAFFDKLIFSGSPVPIVTTKLHNIEIV